MERFALSLFQQSWKQWNPSINNSFVLWMFCSVLCKYWRIMNFKTVISKLGHYKGVQHVLKSPKFSASPSGYFENFQWLWLFRLYTLDYLCLKENEWKVWSMNSMVWVFDWIRLHLSWILKFQKRFNLSIHLLLRI